MTSPGTDGPRVDFRLRIGPHEVAEGALVGNFHVALKHTEQTKQRDARIKWRYIGAASSSRTYAIASNDLISGERPPWTQRTRSSTRAATGSRSNMRHACRQTVELPYLVMHSS